MIEVFEDGGIVLVLDFGVDDLGQMLGNDGGVIGMLATALMTSTLLGRISTRMHAYSE